MRIGFLLLTAAILAVYAWSIRRLLRSESPLCLWLLTLLSVVALFLRLIEWGDYPGGLNDDEPKVLYSAIDAFRAGDLFGQGPTGLPQLIPVLFQVQLIPLLGGTRWAIRLYSIAGSVLSVAVTFAVARGMRLRPIASLSAAAFVAVLPWSLLYGRISQGGELLFNQVLLLAALARLVWRKADWREVPTGALGLCLLFYDYFGGRSMLAMPFAGAVLARGRSRLLCLAIAAVAMFGFLPYATSGHYYALVGLTPLQLHAGYTTNPIETLTERVVSSLSVLTSPAAANGWMTVSAAAMHPWILLGLAVLGLFTGVRQALFLLAGFVVGLMPTIVAHGDITASAHRMHAAYVFIALSAGASLDLIPWRSLRAMAASAVVAFVAVWSITLYFSDDFWRLEARWMFGTEDTDVVESIPWNEPRVVEAELGYYIAMRTDLEPTPFSVEHLSLPGPALFVFSRQLFPLYGFYRPILRPDRMKAFGQAFSVRTAEGNQEDFSSHGWSYTIDCGDLTRSTQIPTLFHVGYTFAGFRCSYPAKHVWRARWRGPASDLRLWFNGSLSIETPGTSITDAGARTRFVDFKVEPNAELDIRITGPAGILAALYDVSRRQEQLPYWEWVDPLPE